MSDITPTADKPYSTPTVPWQSGVRIKRC